MKIAWFLISVCNFAISVSSSAVGHVSDSDARFSEPKQQYPAFGRTMRSEFLLKDDFILLDHGAYGTYPKATRTALHLWQDRAEANPDLWMRREAELELPKVRERLGLFLNADPEDLVMIINTTNGMNAIFRSLIFKQFERILHFSTIYGSMHSLVQYIVDTSEKNVSSLVFPAIYPKSNDALVREFEAFLDQNWDDERPIKIALIDHITSVPGVIVPIERIIPLLKQRGIRVLIDGAHAIGQIPINITALDPDYYITNCHKWLYAARGAAVMYVKKEHQGEIHPAHINSGYKGGSFQKEFFWTGTQDYSQYMSVLAGLDFREAIGGEEAIRAYTHNLAKEGGAYLANLYKSRVLQEEDQMGSMVDVELCIEENFIDQVTNDWWIDTQLYRYKEAYVSVYKYEGKWWGRHSVQIYNDITDFHKAGAMFERICDEVNTNNGTSNAANGRSKGGAFVGAAAIALMSQEL